LGLGVKKKYAAVTFSDCGKIGIDSPGYLHKILLAVRAMRGTQIQRPESDLVPVDPKKRGMD
jgi:hypothetical protein